MLSLWLGHDDLTCPVKKRVEEGYTEDQALRLSEFEKIPDPIAKKSYRKPPLPKTDGGGKQNTNSSATTSGDKEVQHSGS